LNLTGRLAVPHQKYIKCGSYAELATVTQRFRTPAPYLFI